MQSLNRAIRRGNAVIMRNPVTKQLESVYRKGTDSKVWNNAAKDAVVTAKNIDTVPYFMEMKPFKYSSHENN